MMEIRIKKMLVIILTVGVISSTIGLYSLQQVYAPVLDCAKALVRFDTLRVAGSRTGEIEISATIILAYNGKNNVLQITEYQIPPTQFKFNSIDDLDSGYINAKLTDAILKTIKSEPIPTSCKTLTLLIPTFQPIPLVIP